ncbi:hypothetical protein MVEN_00004100 [Mycena venus]|uniref:Uncharacterized protein n=1 Tax=Mycena venus TaxID=2733690 RepID=A0A8H6Z969_9AGAR|nr:hypothetical protein MVEN_00004100 [Mycena venus]
MSSDTALIDAFCPLRAALIPAAYVEVVNGFYSGLYIMTLYALSTPWPSSSRVHPRVIYRVTFKRGTHGFSRGLFLALTSMYILSSIYAISGAVLVQFAFVEHGDTIESSNAYIA